MIRTATQYKEAKDFIDTNPEFYDYTLSEKMNSYEYNLYLQDTQYYFNVLYEKLRELENIIEYLEWYSKKKISAARAKIKSKEAYLDKITALSNSSNYISKIIEPDNSSSIITDRDGNTLKKALVTESGAITSSYLETDRRKIISASKKSNQLCNSDNIDSFSKDGHYISTYLLDKPEVIEEILELELDDVNKFNRLDFEPINCRVEYLGKNENNKIELKLSTDILFKTRKAFNSKPYNNSSLDSLEKINFAPKSSSVLDNLTELNTKLDEINRRKYLGEAENYQNLIAENERKDSFNLETNN